MLIVLNAKVCYKFSQSQSMWSNAFQSYCSLMFTLYVPVICKIRRDPWPSGVYILMVLLVQANCFQFFSEHCLAINYTIWKNLLANSFKKQRAMLNFRALMLEFTLYQLFSLATFPQGAVQVMLINVNQKRNYSAQELLDHPICFSMIQLSINGQENLLLLRLCISQFSFFIQGFYMVLYPKRPEFTHKPFTTEVVLILTFLCIAYTSF